MSKIVSRNTKTGKYWMIFPKSEEAKEATVKQGLNFYQVLFTTGKDDKPPTAKDALQSVIELTGVKGFALAFVDIHPSVEEREKWDHKKR